MSTYAQLDGIEMVDGGRTEELHHVHTHVVIGRPAAGLSPILSSADSFDAQASRAPDIGC